MRAEIAKSQESQVPVLTDGEVTLRSHVPADIDRMVELAADQAKIRWTPIPAPYGRSAAERFALEYAPQCWASGSEMVWAVDVDGRFAGTVDLAGEGVLSHLSFDLHPDARGWGIMRRAVSLAVDHAFTEAGKEVVRWTSLAGNIDALRVAHACGFRLDAAIPDGVELRGEPHAAWVGSLRKDDDREPKTTWHADTFGTERFRLRPLEEKDDPRIRETLDDADSRKYLFARPDPLLDEHAAAERIRKWWTAACGQTCTWAVADKDSDEYFGDVSIFEINEVTGAEIGFYTHPEARGKGVLREGMAAAVDHIFDVIGLRRLTLFAAASNAGSRKLAEACGFREFGTQHLAARSDGIFEDLVGYELFHDWR